MEEEEGRKAFQHFSTLQPMAVACQHFSWSASYRGFQGGADAFELRFELV
jgi:hypothetical protein